MMGSLAVELALLHRAAHSGASLLDLDSYDRTKSLLTQRLYPARVGACERVLTPTACDCRESKGILCVVVKRLLIGKLKAGRYPLWTECRLVEVAFWFRVDRLYGHRLISHLGCGAQSTLGGLPTGTSWRSVATALQKS
eukprot:623808-Amphidinium_carterae.1